MAKNQNLAKAKENKQDEFYTQISDIELEMKHYRSQFKDKIILCNCDDPYESNFFKYFAMNFNFLGLKKLIATCYNGSPVAYTQLSIFDLDEDTPKEDRIAYKVEITKVEDLNGDGAIDLADVEAMLQIPGMVQRLEGNGDFRSEECIELLKEADIVVTNPPFSLFREYIAQLIDFKKNFIVIGNINAISYKEIFPLIRDNKLWMGNGFNMSLVYKTPYKNELEDNRKFVSSKGFNPDDNYIKVPACAWFTNMDFKKRHEDLILYKVYQGHEDEYPSYYNYEGIDVNKVAEIPMDYEGVMGVPITFLDKYNPEQFEIIGLGIGDLAKELGITKNHRGRTDLAFKLNGVNKVPYSRILIRKKVQ